MKKALVVLMMGALLFTACGQSTGAAGSANEPQTEEAQAEAPAEEEAEAEAPAEEAQAEAPAEEAQAEAPAEGEEAQAEAPAEAAEETAGDEDSLGQPKAEQPDYVGYFANAETTELKDVQKLQLETENTLPDNAVKLQSVETDEGSIEEQVVDGVATLEEQDLEALDSVVLADAHDENDTACRKRDLIFSCLQRNIAGQLIFEKDILDKCLTLHICVALTHRGRPSDTVRRV